MLTAMQLDEDLPRIPWRTILDYVQKAFYNDRPICFSLIQGAASEFERDALAKLNEIREAYVADPELKRELVEVSANALSNLRRRIQYAVLSHPDSPWRTGRVITGKQLVIEFQTANIEAIYALNELKRGLRTRKLHDTTTALTNELSGR